MSNASVDAFLRLVNERYRDFKDRLQQFMQTLGLSDAPEKKRRADALLAAAETLRNVLAEHDRPKWLPPIIQSLQRYHRPEDIHCAFDIVKTVALHGAAATNHQWSFDFSDIKPFDFDALYEQYEAESRIPELFDKLVAILEEIIATGEIDSLRVFQTLQKIIANLKRNRKGSYINLICSWDFARTYIKNIVLHNLSEHGPLKHFVKPLVDTLKEMEDAVGEVQESIQAELHKQLKADFPALTYRKMELPALTDDGVIDAEATPLIPQVVEGDGAGKVV